jgi:hypothetical protein
MGAKPKQSDYKASAAEQVDARVAVDRANIFKEKYMPLLKEQMNYSAKGIDQRLRARAVADVQQQTSSNTLAESQRTDRAGDVANATLSSLGVADTNAMAVENKMATNTIGTAQGQAADASSGLSQAARIGTTEALNRAKNKQMVAQAKIDAGAQLATAAVMRGGKEGLFGAKVAKNFNPPSALSSPAPSLGSSRSSRSYGSNGSPFSIPYGQSLKT